jgi:integrase/recombinase XerD
VDAVIFSRSITNSLEMLVRVQRVLMPDSGLESWTVLGDDHAPVGPVERWLAYLTLIERSPNTVKAYAHDLKDWFTYLAGQRLDWRAATLEDVAGFVAWLRLPPGARDGQVAVLPSVEHHCSEASTNRKLAALTSFWEFHARHGVDLGGLLVTLRPAGRGGSSWKPLLQHITKGKPQRRHMTALKQPDRQPKILTAQQVQAILDACQHRRDRLLFAVLYDTGVRIGEALGLRHEDVAVAERELTVMPRANDNHARVKSGRRRTIPVSPGLLRLYADYLHHEYGELDSDFVFVNLWGRPYGHPLSYTSVYDLVRRLRRRTGIAFDPHQFRHGYATELLRRGASMETVKVLLGHGSISTTVDRYGHLTVEDARAALEAAGWFTSRQVLL